MISLVIGVFVGAIFIMGYIPQILSIFKGMYHKNGLDGVSTLFWFLIYFALFITYKNLYMTESHIWVIIPQGINTYFAMFIFLIVVVLKNDLFKIAVFSIGGLFVVNVLPGLIPIDYTQHLATFLISVAYLTQIIHLIRTKSTKGISLLLFTFIAISLLLMIINIVISGSYLLAGWTEMSNLLMILIIIGLTLYYRSKEDVLE